MTINLNVGDRLHDIELPDHNNRPLRLSYFTRPTLIDEKLGFLDGYPLIVIFYRGFFCPRDKQQMRQLVQFQDELAVNYCKLVTIGVDPPAVHAAFRAGLGANWPFLSDENRHVVRQLNILDETEGEYAYRAQPYTFVLRPDLIIHSMYNGWFYVRRPTLDELRRDLRAIMESLSYYSYEAFSTPEAIKIRIPQHEWEAGAPALGASGLPVAQGNVSWFDNRAGYEMLARDGKDEDVFFHFTAIPGEGYRTLKSGTSVLFEIVETANGPVARNVQVVEK